MAEIQTLQPPPTSRLEGGRVKEVHSPEKLERKVKANPRENTLRAKRQAVYAAMDALEAAGASEVTSPKTRYGARAFGKPLKAQLLSARAEVEKAHAEHGADSWQRRCLHLLHSHRVQLFFILLLVLDMLIVITEICLDLEYPSCRSASHGRGSNRTRGTHVLRTRRTGSPNKQTRAPPTPSDPDSDKHKRVLNAHEASLFGGSRRLAKRDTVSCCAAGEEGEHHTLRYLAEARAPSLRSAASLLLPAVSLLLTAATPHRRPPLSPRRSTAGIIACAARALWRARTAWAATSTRTPPCTLRMRRSPEVLHAIPDSDVGRPLPPSLGANLGERRDPEPL